MNYCEQCGGKLTPKTKTHYLCTICKSDFYVNPKGATAIILIDKDGSLLLGRRAHNPSQGKLDCIGGFLDADENFETGAYRELKEESGLEKTDISELEYLGSVYDPYEWQGRVVQTVSVYFCTRLVSEVKPEPGDDIASIEKCKLEDIRKEDVAWEGMWVMLEKLKSQKH